jgi:hypothetical protein
MYRTIDTVHEYRLRYPDTAPIPTLTQSGLLGLLLAAQDRKAAKLARRKAMWKRLCDTPRNACIYVWRTLIEPHRRQPVSRLEIATRQQV